MNKRKVILTGCLVLGLSACGNKQESVKTPKHISTSESTKKDSVSAELNTLTLAEEQFYNSPEYMRYFHTVPYVGDEYYENNISIIFDQTNNQCIMRTYYEKDRTNEVQTEFKIDFNKNLIIYNNYLSGEQLSGSEAVMELRNSGDANVISRRYYQTYLEYGNTKQSITTVEEAKKALISKLVMEPIDIKVTYDDEKQNYLVDYTDHIGEMSYRVYPNGSVEPDYSNELTSYRYPDGQYVKDQAPTTCNKLVCSEGDAIKSLSESLKLTNDPNAGLFISDGGSEDIYIVVYAANLPDGKESQTYKFNMSDGTYELTDE